MQDFVHLHVHTEYSMLDGMCGVKDLVSKVKKLNQKAAAITDHGNMHGAIVHYNACKKADIKPIIGVEAYIAKDKRTDKQIKMGSDQAHITLLAKNFKGYQNLMRLVTIANFEGFSYKPRIDDETLFKYNEGIIVLSGCFTGIFSKLIREGQEKEAIAKFKKYKEIFKNRLYIEIQKHPGFKEQDDLNKKLIKIARNLNLPLVATNDIHYLNKDEAEAQDALLAVSTRKLIADKNRLSMADNPHLYLKSSEEMVNLFTDLPEAIENTVKIADQCDITIPTGQLLFPNYTVKKGETIESELRKLSSTKLKKRYPKITKKIEDRLNYELKVIHDKGYDAYFLITQDLINWAKKQGIWVGPGRGSAAGSLVSYSLGITTIDPFEHGLQFERFLNPQRPTPPDIDIDFADDRRHEVIEYVQKVYGHSHVAGVITFGRMEARVAIRDIGRVLGMPYEEPDKIAKLIPNTPGKKVSIKKSIERVADLAEYYKQPKYKKLMDLASKVEGTIRHSGIHACAIIIADKELPNYTPLQLDRKTGKSMTQYDMYSLDCNVDDDAIGLLKFDFLGLRNLSTIKVAIELVKKYKKETVDFRKIPLDDKKTYQLLSKGETTGVFQLESSGMKRVAINLKPNQFSDITAMLALYRPGPMELIPKFIEGKHNPDSIEYPHETLKPILEETYGIMVYQEQIIQIANVMGGYSLGEADILRRAIGKKKKKLLDQNKKTFISQAIKKKYTKVAAEKVWGYIEAFANYGFNKSHAASYAMISFQTAYLKAHYPVEYMAALMSVESNSHAANRDEKVAIAINSTKKMGIVVLPPDINRSETEFAIEKKETSKDGLAIRFSLPSIKNVGAAAIDNILEVRKELGKFTSFTQFLNKTDGRRVNKRVIESLIKVGCFDKFGTRASMLENLEEIRQQATALQSDIDGQDNLFADIATKSTEIKDTFVEIPEYPKAELLSFEKELLGLYLTENPLADALKLVSKRSTIGIDKIDQSIHQDRTFLIGGIIAQVRNVRTKKNDKPMCFGTIEDETSGARFVCFPKTFKQYGDLLTQDNVVLIKAKVDYNDEGLNLIIDRVSVPKQETIKFEKANNGKEIFVPRKTSKEGLKKLGGLLKTNPGKDSVTIIIPNGHDPKRISLPYGVSWSKQLEKQIADILK